MERESIACAVGAHVNSIDTPIDIGALLRSAVEAALCAHKVAASCAGYLPDYWARVLTSERGILLNKLGLLPEAVQREFIMRWAETLGLRIERKDRAAQQRALVALIEAARLLTDD